MRMREGLVCFVFWVVFICFVFFGFFLVFFFTSITVSILFNRQNSVFFQLASSERAEIFHKDSSRYQPRTLFPQETEFLQRHLQLKTYHNNSEALRHLTVLLQTCSAGRAARSRTRQGRSVPLQNGLAQCCLFASNTRAWWRSDKDDRGTALNNPLACIRIDWWPSNRHRFPSIGRGRTLHVLEMVLY